MVHPRNAGGQYGRIWEWTLSGYRNGYLVRGGPWRNVDGSPSVKRGRRLSVLDRESWESEPAPDVEFRLVRDPT